MKLKSIIPEPAVTFEGEQTYLALSEDGQLLRLTGIHTPSGNHMLVEEVYFQASDAGTAERYGVDLEKS